MVADRCGRGTGRVWFVFLRGDTPDAVDIGAANEQLDADLAAEAGTDDGADDVAATGDDAVGETDGDTEAIDDEAPAEDATQDGRRAPTANGSSTTRSGARLRDGQWQLRRFRVDEELTVGAVVAVGRTGG